MTTKVAHGLLSLFLSSTLTSASAIYQVQVVQSPPGASGVVMSGVNDAGQVAGTANFYGGGPAQAFIASTSGATLIPLPAGWTRSAGVAINDAGQVAGDGSQAGASIITQIFVGSTGTSLPTGYSLLSGIVAVNDIGELTGTLLSGTTNRSQAFISSTSGISFIPIPPGFSNSEGFDVNSSGQVTGNVVNSSTIQPFIGTTAGSELIPMPLGWVTAGGPVAINDSGEVAGDGIGPTGSQAYVGSASGLTLIPKPAGWSSASVGDIGGALNNSGTVVGGGERPVGGGAYTSGGWIWDPMNGASDLNDLVPMNWIIYSGLSISDNGNILALGADVNSPGTGPQYLLLTPESQVPEPGT